MVVSIDANGRYCVALNQTEQILLNKISVAAVRTPEKVLGNLLFGALVIESLEIDAVDDSLNSEGSDPDGSEPYNPADRD